MLLIYFISQFLSIWRLLQWEGCQSTTTPPRGHKADRTWVANISKETTCVVVSSRICRAIKDEVVVATSKVSNSTRGIKEACNKICLVATVEATMEWCSSKITLWTRVDRTSRATSKIVLTIIKLSSANFTKGAETVLMVPDALSPMEARSCSNAARNNLIRMEENKKWICRKIWTTSNNRWWHHPTCILIKCNTSNIQALTRMHRLSSIRMDKETRKLCWCKLHRF